MTAERAGQRILSSGVFAAGVIITCAVLAGGCGKKQSQGQNAAGFSVNVVGYAARVQPIEERISLVGTLYANESVEIKSEIDGTIDEVSFREGQAVAGGDVLFRIDQRKLKAVLEQAQADLSLADATASRYEQLVKTLAVSQQEYDRVKADLESSRAAFELAKEQLADATIRAPFDGIMGRRLISAGQFISKGTSLGFLVDYDPVKAGFYVPERHLGQTAVGQKIVLKVVAYPEQEFTGEVYFIDPRIDEVTRTALMKALVPNPEGRLRPGMFAHLDVVVKVRAAALVIPETALMMSTDRVMVYTVDANNTAGMREIKTGLRFDGMVEITSGLREGDTVIIEGTQKVRDGAAVNVRF